MQILIWEEGIVAQLFFSQEINNQRKKWVSNINFFNLNSLIFFENYSQITQLIESIFKY